MDFSVEQLNIINAMEKNIVVNAAAGSGKTRTLTERLKKLIEWGINPAEIVCITFTNLAADELKERLKDVPQIGDCFVGTIHSFANRIYGESGIHYELLLPERELLIYEEILNKKEFSALSIKRFYAYLDLKQKVEKGKASETQLSNFLTPSEAGTLKRCEGPKRDIMLRDNLITFDELLEFTTDYYKRNNLKVDCVLVDEFQDVGTLEAKFIFGLRAERYFIVGKSLPLYSVTNIDHPFNCWKA